MKRRILLDTNILIALLQKKLFLDSLKKKGRIYVSTITVMELHALPGMNEKEQEEVKNSLALMHIASVTATIAERAGILMRTRPGRNKKLDLIIAATALQLNVPLLSYNIKDFKNINGLRLESPI